VATLFFYFAQKSGNRLFISLSIPVGILCDIIFIGLLAKATGKL